MKKLSTTAKQLIALPVLFLLSAIFIALNGNDEGIFMYPAMFFLFAFILDIILLIVTFFKTIYRKATKKHSDPDLSFTGIDINHYVNLKDNIYYDKSNGELILWGRIILLSCTLFPFGLYFMCRKVMFEKLKYYYNGIVVLIFGITLFLLNGSFFLLLFLLSGFPPLILSVPLIFMSVLGLSLAIIGFFVKEAGKTNDKFIKALFIDKVTSIDEIAKIFKSNYFKTCKKIQNLIDNGILNNIYIHHKEREIIINGISSKIAIKCKNCAGTTVVQENEERICCYCGAKI